MAILDAYGNPYTPPKKPDVRHLATAMIRDKYSSYPSKGLTPQRLAAIFKEADGGDVYRQAELMEEMEEKDTHLGSVLQTRKLAVAGLDYEIIPASDETRAKEYAAYIEEKVRNFDDWEDLMLDILDATGKGISLNELYWEIQDGEAIVAGYEWVHPKNLTFMDKDRVLRAPRLITENEPVYGEDLIPHKFVYHRYKARSGHPSRQGLIRTCAWAYLFKNYTLKDWVAFAEVFGMPLRIGRFDPNASEADKDTLVEAIIQLGADGGAVISKSTEIELKEAQRSGSVNVYDTLFNAMNKEMSKSVLGQTATTEETPGKLGAAPEKDKVRQDLLEADAKAVQKTIKQDVFRQLIGFNKGWDQIGLTPSLKLGYEPPSDRFTEAKTLQVAVRAIGLPVGKQYAYEKLGIPAPQDGEEVITPPAVAPRPSPAIGLRSFDSAQDRLRSGQGLTAHSVNIDDQALSEKNYQETIDALVDEAMGEAAGKFKGMLEPVMKLIESSASLREIRLELASVYPEMDTAGMEDLLAKAMYLADLAGRASVGS